MHRKIVSSLTVLFLVSGFLTGCSQESTGYLKGAGVAKINAKPFEGKNMVQVGIVVGDVEKYARSYAEFFGVEVPKIIWSETEDKAKTRFHGKPTYARVKQAFFHFDNITVELLEPVDGPSTWKEFLDSHGEGVHHLAFEIKGMDGHIAEMEDRGAPLIQQGRWTGGSGGRYAYFESGPQLAVIFELLENL